MVDSTPEGIDATRVSAWLCEHIEDLQPPITYRLLAGGHSNLTYSCTDASGRMLVLRRPPLGHVLESAHDMAREHRVISALSDSGVPVALCLGLCEDPAVNDAPFYIMAFVAGTVLHDDTAVAGLPSPERQSISTHVAQVLSRLHSIEPAQVGLETLGRHEGYIARQIKRWTRQWEATITHPIPAMEACASILAERMPQQHGTAIVHGDYRLGNFIVADGRIQAVLDWELCTLGDALADVAYLMNSWVDASQTMAGVDDHMPTVAGGFAPREAVLEAYAEASGRDVSQIDYYRAFSFWRLASIRQGVYKRYLEGAMGSEHGADLEKLKRGVEGCAAAAYALLDH